MEQREMRRKDRQVSEERAREIIRTCDYGMLMTASNAAEPYGVPVNHVLEGDTIYFHCALKGRKLDNIQENPQVCMGFVARAEVDQAEYTTRYESAVVGGTAAMITDEAEKTKALQLICDRYCPEMAATHAETIRKGLPATGVCRVDIQYISGKANAPKM